MPGKSAEAQGTKMLMIFVSGEFTLDEVNNYAIEAFDNHPMRADYQQFFQHEVAVWSMGLTSGKIPRLISYIADHYSVLETVEEYTFYMLKQQVATFAKDLRASDKEWVRKVKRTRRERIRLGFPPLPGTSNAEIAESRILRDFSSSDYTLDHDPLPFEFSPSTVW